MPPEVQQAIANFLGALAIIITALGSVFAAYYRVRSQASAENSKKQAVAADMQVKAIPDLAAQMAQILNAFLERDKQNDLNVKRALDQREPLDSALKQNADVMTQVKDAMMLVSRTLNGTIKQMTDASGFITEDIKTEVDAQADDLRARLLNVGADVTGNADKLTTLTTIANEHSTMTEKALNDLREEIAKIPETIQELIQLATAEQEAQNAALRKELTAATAERDTERARAIQLSATLQVVQGQLKKALDDLKIEKALHAQHENTPAATVDARAEIVNAPAIVEKEHD